MRLEIPKIIKSLNELFDRFKFQLYVLCIWKNIQIYKRNKVRLCIEILWPLLFVGIVVLMRYNYGDRAYLRQDECHFYSKPLLSAGFFEFLHGYICHFNNTCHQEYVENDNFFANQASQLSAAFMEINKFMEEDKNGTENILIQLLAQLGQYDSHKSDKQTDNNFQRKEFKTVKDKFSMGDFINLHQYFLKILRLPKVRRVLRHFQPLLNQFKNWISGSPTLYDDDLIAIIGGMKLVCGSKFYLDNEHLEKINVETFLKEILLKPFKTEYRDMKSEFCQNLDEKIKEIPMLNKIWITIKPLFIGKLLFTPRNIATWKIMQNVNSTFERFAFYHKFTSDFMNFLIVAFQRIKDIEGEEAFRNHKIDILSFTKHLEMAYKLSSKISEALDCLNVDRIEGFSTESELVDHARHHIDQNTFFAGVVFLDMEDNKKEGSTDNLTTILNFVRYKIRMDSQKIESTDSLFDDEEPHSPRRHPLTHLKYYYHGFVILQELLDTAIADISSFNSVFNESYIHKPRVTLQQIPHPCYNRDEFLRSFYWILPLQICLSWTLTIAIIILNMAEESKNHLHQYYRILGLNDTVLILAQLATLLIPTFISSVLSAFLLFRGRILLYSDTLAIVFILFNFGLTTVCLGILLGTLLRKYTVSPYIGILLHLLLTFLPYYVNKAQPNLVFVQRIFLWLIPSAPFLETFIKIIDLEIAQVGLQWNKIIFRENDTPMSFIDNFVIMICDAILFIGASIMVEKAKTIFYWDAYNKLWKIIKQRFQNKKEGKKEKVIVKKFIQNNQYMETEPTNIKCSLEIINWTKETVNGRLLDNVSMKFYENQIICILTDNSTTESALISIIRKLPHHDSGSIIIYGNKDSDHINPAYRNIEYMPTYEIVIEELTVEENLWFYTKLKNSEINIKTKDIEGIMKSAELYDARYTLVHRLPPYMVRRLCVAIAIVGNGKIVLLQDPFSGLDFYSTHILCGMLAEYKMGRTIIMTTSDINNARVVSDKIAIINEGRLLGYGSKNFLRAIFTKGFELMVELGKTEDIISLAKQLKFLNIPEMFETEIHQGIETEGHLTSIFLQIMRHFIPNSDFIKKQGQKYIFVLPYLKEDILYDCIGSNLALKKLFCLLDRCRSQWNTLKYEFRTSSLNEVYNNIKLCTASNLANNQNTFFYQEMDFAKLLYSSSQSDILSKSSTSTMNNNSEYLILSSDSASENFIGFKQLINIQIARFKRNYRNGKFVVQLVLVPFLILFLTTFWIKFIPIPTFSYPVPLTVLLKPNVEVFLKGYTEDNMDISEKNQLGRKIFTILISSSTTLYIKSLGNKCVYFMESNDIDPMTSNNGTDCSMGPGYKNIYETINTNICKTVITRNDLKPRVSKDLYRKKYIYQNRCLCNSKDGNLNCPIVKEKPVSIKTKTSFYLGNLGHVPILPAFLISHVFKYPLYIGGFDRLLKNDSSDIPIMKLRQNLKIYEFLQKVTSNTSYLPINLRTTYSNQIHYLRYMSHIPTENAKIWFNNRFKIGVPSLLSLYDTAYFRTIIILKNDQHNFSNRYVENRTITHFSNRQSPFAKQIVNYIDIYAGNDYGIITINQPLYSSLKTNTIIYLYLLIYVKVCVVSLIATLIIWDMFEDTQNYPHSFQLHNIQPLFQMLSHLMYNFGIYILTINVCILVFRINIINFDKYDHLNNTLIYVLYGYALIPFMLTITCLKPRYSKKKLNIINNGIGFLCLLLVFTTKIFELEKKTMNLVIAFLIPHYGFAKISFLIISKTIYPYKKRSPHISENILVSMREIFWALILSGIFYYALIICHECKIFMKAKKILSKYFNEIKLINFLKHKFAIFYPKDQGIAGQLQENKFQTKLDKNTIKNKDVNIEGVNVETSDPSLFPILIKNINDRNLKKVNLKVQNGCCMGLFGTDSEITSIARILTGEQVQFQGDIHVMSYNIKMKQVKLSDFIGYLPKNKYLNLYLTPRESLEFYAHHKYSSSTSKKVVNFLINHFNINEQKWVKNCLESTKKKIMLAIAFMLNPPILILTDPFKDLNIKDSMIVKKTILDMKSMGKCILLISRTIKDYEICSNLAIFADKKIKCFGSIQDLRTRYEGGYVVSIEFNKSRKNLFTHNTVDLISQRLLGTFSSCRILERQISYLEVYIYCLNLHVSRIFVTLEAVRNLYGIYNYSVTMPPLEKILAKFNDSYEDHLGDDMLAGKRTCNIPYVPDFI